jgi:hypothetical protein
MPLFVNPYGQPGTQNFVTTTPINIWYANSEYAQYVVKPVTIDGFASGDPTNATYPFNLNAGTVLGILTSVVTANSNIGDYAPSIIGLTTMAYVSGGTTLTVGTAQAAELLRRCGATGTLTITGPPAASGALNSLTATYSNVVPSTGVITITSLADNFIAGSVIGPTDGSQNPKTLLADQYGVPVADGTNITRINVFPCNLVVGGGTINSPNIAQYPTDPSLQGWLKAAIKSYCSNGISFVDDQ